MCKSTIVAFLPVCNVRLKKLCEVVEGVVEVLLVVVDSSAKLLRGRIESVESARLGVEVAQENDVKVLLA